MKWTVHHWGELALKKILTLNFSNFTASEIEDTKLATATCSKLFSLKVSFLANSGGQNITENGGYQTLCGKLTIQSTSDLMYDVH